MRIGVVDSGIGGLTTLKELMSKVDADYYYYMDNLHVPYGNRSYEDLLAIAQEIMGVFMNVGVDIIVIACNTMSSMLGDKLRILYDVPIVCIEPSVKPAYLTGRESIVLATRGTVNSYKFKMLLSKYPKVKYKASDTLATYIENHNEKCAKCELLAQLAGETCQNVVLGCTHYVYLKEYIEYLGYEVFEGNTGVANRVQDIVKSMGKGEYSIKAEENACIIANNEEIVSHQLVLQSTNISIHMSRLVDIAFIEDYLGCKVNVW